MGCFPCLGNTYLRSGLGNVFSVLLSLLGKGLFALQVREGFVCAPREGELLALHPLLGSDFWRSWLGRGFRLLSVLGRNLCPLLVRERLSVVLLARKKPVCSPS